MDAKQILGLFEKGNLLKTSIRKKVNNDITKFITNIYFKEIPLKELFSILEKHGIIVLQEDMRKWSGILVGKNETTSFDIAPVESKNGDEYIPYGNAKLFLQWYKMGSGKYEITAYVS